MVAKLWSRISSLIQVGTFQFLERQVDFGGFSNKKKKSTRKVNISRSEEEGFVLFRLRRCAATCYALLIKTLLDYLKSFV